jgi:L-fuconolactonase
VILDGHCHAWRRWPYLPPVPDEHHRGTIEQLLFELDGNGVDQALVVCAAIENNPDNIEYVALAHQRHPDRLHVLADLDCTWSATYHKPGSAARLRALTERYELAGFAHYLGRDNDGWLSSDEADTVFALADERDLLISLGAGPGWQADLRDVARRYPRVPVLCQSLGGIWVENGSITGLNEVLASADVPNIYIKVAGFSYTCPRGWDYPWPETVAALEAIYESYGPGRLCWGSDFPACTRFCNFRQSLEVVRTHCAFLSECDLELVLGGNLRSILAR